MSDQGFGDNMCEAGWVEDREWWFRRAFTVAKGLTRTREHLEFDGLDTFATVIQKS